jgi:hypothetical protein
MACQRTGALVAGGKKVTKITWRQNLPIAPYAASVPRVDAMERIPSSRWESGANGDGMHALIVMTNRAILHTLRKFAQRNWLNCYRKMREEYEERAK